MYIPTVYSIPMILNMFVRIIGCILLETYIRMELSRDYLSNADAAHIL